MDNRAIIRFVDVALRSSTHHAADLTQVSFALVPGELAWVRFGSHSRHVPICDLAEGLVEPHEGYVEFMGERWREMTYTRQAELRGRIGRVFDGQGWVSNLSVYDNVVLSQRHHTTRPEQDIHREAEHLARTAGVFPLPDGALDAVPAADLKRMEWVRAFLGAPRLILLERPELGVADESLSGLVDLVAAATAAGTAVLWMPAGRDAGADKRLTVTQRFSIEDGAWSVDSGG